MKFLKSLFVLLLSSLLIIGSVSCQNEENNPEPKSKIIKEVSTNGTVAGAETNSKGLLEATLETEDGAYIFIESPLNTNETPKTGTWTYTEADQTTPKYSGSYTGDISKLANEATTLTLIVKKALVNGELKRITTTESFDLEASETEFEATIPRVEVNTTTIYETPVVKLPDPVGENPFTGKTFVNEWNEGSEETPETITETWIFTDSTVTMKEEKSWFNGHSINHYEYSYDSSQNLLYLLLKKVEVTENNKIYSFSNYLEYVQMMISRTPGINSIKDVPNTILLTTQSIMLETFGFFEVQQYEIDDSSDIPSLELTPYFNGTLPSESDFWSIDWNPEHTKPEISTHERYCLRPIGSDSIADCYICWPLIFDDNSFSGIITIGTGDEYLGDFECYYTSTGKGTSGCTLKIMFTELPEEIRDFETYKEYILTND